MPVLIQIVRPLSVVAIIIGFILLFGAGGLNGFPVDVTNLVVACIMVIAGFSGLKYISSYKNKGVVKINKNRSKMSAKTLRLIGLFLIVLGVLLFLGNIYNTRYYIQLIFMRVDDMSGMLDTFVKYKHVFGQMLISLMVVVAGVYLRKAQVIKNNSA